MTPPHSCGKSQGGGRPLVKFFATQRGPCLFLVRACLGCGSSTSARLVVPRFNDSLRNRPDAIFQRAGDSI